MSTRITEAMVEAAAKAAFAKVNEPHLSPEKIEALWPSQHRPHWDGIARACLAAAGEAEGWRSMDSAPKDGTFIITRAGRWLRPAVVHWATYDGVAKWGGDPEGFMEEDHFMQYWTEVRYEPIEWLPLEALDALPVAPLPEGTHHGR